MKKLMVVALVLASAFSVVGVAAQEMSFRRAVVTGIAPIQVQGHAEQAASRGPSATGGALGRVFGRAVGRAVSRAAGEYGYEAAEVASSLVQDASTARTAAGQGGAMVTAYMVMVRFDNGQESAIQMASTAGLRVGGKVNVIGSGSATQLVPAS